jgi:hypothetical protein
MTRWRPRTRAVVTMLVLVGASACPRPLPPPPPHVAKVAVLPPVDRTGDGLLVAGGSLLERYAFHSPRVTVPDLLAAEAREWLRTRGVALVGAEAIENDATLGSNVATLRLDVWRWEPDSDTQPVSVLVGLEATLVDVASRRRIQFRPQVPSRSRSRMRSRRARRSRSCWRRGRRACRASAARYRRRKLLR